MTCAATVEPVEPERASISAWWGLLVLTAIGLYMYMDRHVLALQMETIRLQLSMDDFQVGMVLGLSIAIFAAVIGYPIAWLSDRIGRRAVLVGSILVWSAAVAACGLSRNFEQMFAASAIVGAGESGLLPITYALIPELFRGQTKIAANSAMIVAGRIGSGVIIAVCGALIASMNEVRPYLPETLQQMESWRLAMLATALPGPLLAALVYTLPLGQDAPKVRSQPRAVAPVFPFLRPQLGTFLYFYGGVGFMVFGLSAVGGFLPVAAAREFGAAPEQIGTAMGAATVATMAIAFPFVILSTRFLVARLGASLPIWVLLFTTVGAGAATIVVPFVATFGQLTWLFATQLLFVSVGTMLFPTALQDMTPASLRARLVSIIITVNIVLSAVSQPVVGLVSDRLHELDNGLRVAIALVGGAGFALAALLLYMCALKYPRTVSEARAFETQTP